MYEPIYRGSALAATSHDTALSRDIAEVEWIYLLLLDKAEFQYEKLPS